ncbi:YaaA family protein [Herbidospora cretacea]|uniref:YaaA family protein n=1 Tax=Herbidospora cretacea TaxID=28444 RepID=UPI0004C2F56E|nr:peroxide stress protein YaaA [Herbidospora cretacea]
MLILLPPSEGKAASGRGRPVDLDSLSFPELTSSREKVLDALVDLCHNPEQAHQVLGLPPGLADEIGRNRGLRSARTVKVSDLYTGVLYDALSLATLDSKARARATKRIVVFSGLWGALRLGDRVPPYRLSMGVRLPPVGGLAAFWKPSLGPVLDEGAGLVVDLRSSTYAAAWKPRRETVAVRVLRHDGTVVSHMAKLTRGRIARSLVESPSSAKNADELAHLLTRLGHAVELHPGRLDVVLSS